MRRHRRRGKRSSVWFENNSPIDPGGWRSSWRSLGSRCSRSAPVSSATMGGWTSTLSSGPSRRWNRRFRSKQRSGGGSRRGILQGSTSAPISGGNRQHPSGVPAAGDRPASSPLIRKYPGAHASQDRPVLLEGRRRTEVRNLDPPPWPGDRGEISHIPDKVKKIWSQFRSHVSSDGDLDDVFEGNFSCKLVERGVPPLDFCGFPACTPVFERDSCESPCPTGQVAAGELASVRGSVRGSKLQTPVVVPTPPPPPLIEGRVARKKSGFKKAFSSPIDGDGEEVVDFSGNFG